MPRDPISGFCPPQLGAESADSIGAVLNSKDEQREIAETRETCRWVLVGLLALSRCRPVGPMRGLLF